MAGRSIVKMPPARVAAVSVSIGHELVRYVVAKARRVAVKGQLSDSDGTVALFRNNDFCQPVDFLATLFPALIALVELFVRLILAPGRLRTFEVVLLAIDKQDHVRVLFDGAGFPQIGQLRALVLTLFDLTTELRQSDHWNVELLCNRFEPARDLGHL